jgi:hypothetical protein
MYGSISMPASGRCRQKTTIVATISAHSTRISANARPGDCRPKKMADHAALNSRCTTNSVSAAFAAPRYLSHTSHAATPMSTYSSVQTGPNTQLGGFHDGFSSVVNHCPGGKRLPMPPPTTSGNATHRPSATHLFTRASPHPRPAHRPQLLSTQRRAV